MISPEFIDTLNSIRECLLESLGGLDTSSSFTLLQKSMGVDEVYGHVKSNLSEKILQPFENRFVLAIAGSSGHGKTTILNEMFPSLAERGWLVTDVTDTTSQSLRIEYARPGTDLLQDVKVNSWKIEQIKKLLNSEEVAKQNSTDNIRVNYQEDQIEVDGTDASFPEEDLENFRFPLKQTLRPFSEPYQIPKERLTDPKYIRSLTTKEPSGKLDTHPIIETGDSEYNSLQLRAVVKDISLHDNYDTIKKWSGLDDGELQGLVFVDTPGIAVSGSVKDEVLRHPLEYKSNQILLELLRNDELDIIIHLVLCGQHSDFSTLWKALEAECGSVKMDDLTERLILAVNGANIYFTNVDLKEHVDEGDQFEITIEENVLQKMSPRGRIQPSRICFLDSKKIVENMFGGDSYQRVYDGYRDKMNAWVESNSKPHVYLKEQNLLESFQSNVRALCDPEDRGQGFLIQQAIGLIREKGPRLLLKKYLIRTELLAKCEQLFEVLTSYYDETGGLNLQVTQDAIHQVFSVFHRDGMNKIHDFCLQHIDSEIETIVLNQAESGDWIVSSFERCCHLLIERVIAETKPPDEIRDILREFFSNQVNYWSNTWGYEAAKLPAPSESNKRTLILLSHSIKTHVREILYQLSVSHSDDGGNQSLTQTDEDRQTIAAIIQGLKTAVNQGNELCHRYGVER